MCHRLADGRTSTAMALSDREREASGVARMGVSGLTGTATPFCWNVRGIHNRMNKQRHARAPGGLSSGAQALGAPLWAADSVAAKFHLHPPSRHAGARQRPPAREVPLRKPNTEGETRSKQDRGVIHIVRHTSIALRVRSHSSSSLMCQRRFLRTSSSDRPQPSSDESSSSASSQSTSATHKKSAHCSFSSSSYLACQQVVHRPAIL
jgi:hypothetical protein